jgi:hypothetical protein
LRIGIYLNPYHRGVGEGRKPAAEHWSLGGRYADAVPKPRAAQHLMTYQHDGNAVSGPPTMHHAIGLPSSRRASTRRGDWNATIEAFEYVPR